MKVGDLVESALKGSSRRAGIIIRPGRFDPDSVLIFWPGEEPVWEWRCNLLMLREQA